MLFVSHWSHTIIRTMQHCYIETLFRYITFLFDRNLPLSTMGSVSINWLLRYVFVKISAICDAFHDKLSS